MGQRVTTDQNGANIENHFIKLNIFSSSGDAYGGAIYNTSRSGIIESITGNFIGNYTSAITSTDGEVIYNAGTLSLVTKGKDMEFTGNYTTMDKGITKISSQRVQLLIF